MIRVNIGNPSQVHPLSLFEDEEQIASNSTKKKLPNRSTSIRNNPASVASTPINRGLHLNLKRYSVREIDCEIKGLARKKKKKSLDPEEFDRPFSVSNIKSQWSKRSVKSFDSFGPRSSSKDLDELESEKKLKRKNDFQSIASLKNFEENEKWQTKSKESGKSRNKENCTFKNQVSIKSVPNLGENFAAKKFKRKGTENSGRKREQSRSEHYFGLQEGPKRTLGGEDIDIIKTTGNIKEEKKEEESAKESPGQNFKREFARRRERQRQNSKYFLVKSEKMNVYRRLMARLMKHGLILFPDDKFKLIWTMWIFAYSKVSEFLISFALFLRS